MRLPAIDCVRRGIYNARANWELILVQWAGLMVAVVLTVASLLPLLLIIGFAGITALRTPQDAGEWIGDWMSRAVTELFTFSAPMVLAVVAAIAIGTLGMLVYCFVQAGLYGVLVAADRQAPAGPPGDWRLFRTFSGPNFRGWGAHHVWRFFWFYNLVLVVFTVLAAGFALLIGLVAVAGQAWGGVAAVGVGCGGMLPLIFLLLVAGLWVWAAQADLANADSTVAHTSRRALRLVGRRFGGLLLIVLIGMAASVALSMVFLPLSMATSLVFRDSFAAGMVLRGVLVVIQWGASGAIQVALAGAMVALVRSELREAGA